MQPLNRKNQDVSLGFDDMAKFVMEINCELQNRIYKKFKFYSQQFSTKAILENEKNNFLKAYYQEHNPLQTSAEIENGKQQKIDHYLKLVSAYFEEEVCAAVKH